MNWGSVGEFLDMGGRGLYVWGSYAVFGICLAIETFSLIRRRKMLRRNPPENSGNGMAE